MEIVESLFAAAPTNQDILNLREQLTAKLGLQGESHRTHALRDELHQLKNQGLAEEINKTMALAANFMNEGHTEQGEQLYQTILTLEPDYPPALMALAQHALNEQAHGKAQQLLLRGNDKAQSHRVWQLLLVRAESGLGEYARARQRCLQSYKQTQDTAFLRQLLVIYLKEANWLEASKLAKQCLRDDPERGELHYTYARATFELLKQHHQFTQAKLTDCYQIHLEALPFVSDQQANILNAQLGELDWYTGDIDQAQQRLEGLLAAQPDDHALRFNLAFVYRTQMAWEKFYSANEAGLDCGRRLKYNGDLPRWDLSRPQTDAVLIMPEQGVGDELAYFHNVPMVVERARKVYVGCDPRLEPVLSQAFPSTEVVPISRKDGKDIFVPEHVLADIDSWVAGGSLAGLCYQHFERHLYQQTYITPDVATDAPWISPLAKLQQQGPVFGLCWRSGLAAATRNIHYLVAEELAGWIKSVRQRCPDAQFVNLQYGECGKELSKINKQTGVEVVSLPGLDLKNDFMGTAHAIKQLSGVFTAGTAVHRLTVAVGTPCYVFFAGHKESDIQTPDAMPGNAEYAFSYPPMLKDKQPLLDAMARRMVDDLCP
ncbi:tetratricopeptide repeat protein [Salinivibrio socompensis]|uniref:tetratricopeptide repeat protein n=1 Tax=Salinivibrio socompensis TaxID=1510206 RepID=UPI000FE13E90|nr:tetratricopeptide repeat protein [Salinivibrio socompensis]